MKNMTTFIKWFLFNAVFLTVVILAETQGAISTMIKNDVSYLTIVIMILYVTVSGLIGKLCYLAYKTPYNIVCKDDRSKLLKLSYIVWFAADHFFSLGFLGTVFVLCLSTATNFSG